jgi:hypothetical protein
MLFPEQALVVLRQARWDALALRSYELMSGGFHWSDERLLGDVAFLCMEQGCWAFRFIIGYRASLIRSAPREELRAPWEQLLRECPNWPGFRQERSSPELLRELETEDERTARELDQLTQEIERRAGRRKE